MYRIGTMSTKKVIIRDIFAQLRLTKAPIPYSNRNLANGIFSDFGLHDQLETCVNSSKNDDYDLCESFYQALYRGRNISVQNYVFTFGI